jgi:hypothetical protein
MHTSLVHGIPTVVYPFFGDQYIWARQCISRGNGQQAFSPGTGKFGISSKVLRVLEDYHSYSARAAKLMHQVRKEDLQSVDQFWSSFNEFQSPHQRKAQSERLLLVEREVRNSKEAAKIMEELTPDEHTTKILA